MPTQEERLSALEKFQKVAAAHIRETEENTTIFLGVIREQGRDIKRMVQHLETIDDRLDTLEQHMESRFETMESRFGTLESRFGTLESHFEAQDKKLDQMLHLLTTLTAKPGQET